MNKNEQVNTAEKFFWEYVDYLYKGRLVNTKPRGKKQKIRLWQECVDLAEQARELLIGTTTKTNFGKF